MRVTGASSVTNVDSYGEARRLSWWKGTVSRQRTLGQVAGTAVGVGHLWYGSRVPNRGAFQFCIQNILSKFTHYSFPLHGKILNKFLQDSHNRHIIVTAVIVSTYLLFEIKINKHILWFLNENQSIKNQVIRNIYCRTFGKCCSVQGT